MINRLIMVVDDEPEILNIITAIFESAGYHNIVTADSGEHALQLCNTKMPDIIISDVMMPGMDGFELLTEIRMISRVPFLLLTARNEAEDRYSGFELGADDYLSKPFLPRELLLRTEAILKRTYKDDDKKITLNYCQIDLGKALVITPDKEMTLTSKEMLILEKLYENEGRIVTVGTLCQCLCGDIWTGYESSLMTHIRHLREKIEESPSNPVSLVTVKGLGYKLITISKE